VFSSFNRAVMQMPKYAKKAGRQAGDCLFAPIWSAADCRELTNSSLLQPHP
jgi:hypothetical protein